MAEYKLYNGDCREMIKEIADNSVDVVITDPPYGMNYDSGWSGASVHLDGTRLCLRMYRQLLPELSRVMKDNSHLYWFTRWDVYPDAYDAIAPFMPVKNLLIWDKNHPGMGNLEVYGYSYEMAIFAGKGHKKLNGNRPNSIFQYKPVPVPHRVHVTEKPKSLLRDWLERSTNPGDWVLDPFMGSGSAGVVCMELGVNFIGFEINKDYFEIAENQISAAKSQGAMFRHLTPRAVDLRDSPALPGFSTPEG